MGSPVAGVNWGRILAPIGIALATAVGGAAGSSAGSVEQTDELRELRNDIRAVSRDVASLRNVVDSLGVQVVKVSDGQAAARASEPHR